MNLTPPLRHAPSTGTPEAPLRMLEVNPSTDSRWNSFVVSHPQGRVYHTANWLTVLHRAYGYDTFGLACEDADGRILGLMPLAYRRGILTGRQLSSLPHTPIAGPLARDSSIAAFLIDAATDVAESRWKAWLQLKLPFARAEELRELDERYSERIARWRTSFVLTLPSRPSDLQLSKRQGSIKRALNKAARSGVQVVAAEDQTQLSDWYALYLLTQRTHSVPPLPYRFFRTMWEVLLPQGQMRLLLAIQTGSPQTKLLAGCLLLMSNNTVFFAFNGRDPQYLPLRPNDALQWHAIRLACEEGFRFYDLGEVAKDQHGLADFKRKWGAEPSLLYRYYYPASRGPDGREVTAGTTVARALTALRG